MANNAVKKIARIEIDGDLLSVANSLGIDLAETLEKALCDKIAGKSHRQWLQENLEALKNCNALAEENGLFADKHRPF